MSSLWHDGLVSPMLATLLFLYRTLAFGNLGVAVIELTVLLRLALLPLTILAERSSARYERLSEEVASIQEQYKNDEVLANEQIRELLKRRKINPWAKATVLLVQFAALLALYQVFTRGALTPDVDPTFFGFDIGKRNIWWALSVGIVLYLEISHEQRQVEHLLGKQDAVYRYAFPLFSVVVLSLLPMVKAIFVLTSMAFSLIVSTVRHKLWPTVSTN
ncbi:MAG TPA: YidC/Oxa1 family membrane protein insertase [Candidatus Baltobacteraceae bacterium]|nr:YidC/Oxa1 family membrane protein insertase [Candidatus Baltobacteraceae bacterium]